MTNRKQDETTPKRWRARTNMKQTHALPEPDESMSRLRIFLSLIAPFKPGKMLDLGAGPGTFSLAAARLGWEVTAVDVRTMRTPDPENDPKRTKLIRSVRWVKADVRDFPIREGEYDLICIFGLMHHLELNDQIKLLKRCSGMHTLLTVRVAPEIVDREGPYEGIYRRERGETREERDQIPPNLLGQRGRFLAHGGFPVTHDARLWLQQGDDHEAATQTKLYVLLLSTLPRISNAIGRCTLPDGTSSECFSVGGLVPQGSSHFRRRFDAGANELWAYLALRWSPADSDEVKSAGFYGTLDQGALPRGLQRFCSVVKPQHHGHASPLSTMIRGILAAGRRLLRKPQADLRIGEILVMPSSDWLSESRSSLTPTRKPCLLGQLVLADCRAV